MKNIKFTVIIFLIFLLVANVKAQQSSYNILNFKAIPFGSLKVSDLGKDWYFSLKNLEGITEGNRTYRQHLLKLKEESASRFPAKAYSNKGYSGSAIGTAQVPDPVIQKNFMGNLYSYSVPNDNILAISNGDQLISAINTNIYFYDTKNDTLLKTASLNAFAAPLTGISPHQYDPKLLYDPQEDKFVLVFLAGSSSDTITDIVVAFSETNDMMGNWNLYSLPGNPLNDTSWTDFPAIALSDKELFLTVNLLNYGTSWQTSFKQTVVWQIDKFAGYSGQILNTRLWNNIIYNGQNIRNIHPIQGADQLYGPNMYLLSNRNFTIYSDSIFLLEITGDLSDTLASLEITHLTADVGYGAPPDAKQPKTVNVLATNDARVLGGFLHNNKIQFVGNSIDTTTGKAAIYHGVLNNVKSNPTINGRIIAEPGMEFGYPNISFSGKTALSQQAIIGFNHTGDSAFPGVSAILFDGNNGYSNRIEIKTGEYIINILSGLYERWGDYTGNQRKYNEPGVVWISGMFGVKTGIQMHLGTQIAKLESVLNETSVVSQRVKRDILFYPNPFADMFSMEFTLDNPGEVIIELRSLTGQTVQRFFQGGVQQGKNVVAFSTLNLDHGVYMLCGFDNSGRLIFSEKVIKASR